MRTRTRSELTAIIRQAGQKVTQPRLRVLTLLRKSPYPLSIKKIIEHLGRTAIDPVTVYRVLSAFKRAGIVNQIDFQEDHAYYEFNDTTHDHHHIVCVACRTVQDFVGCEFPTLADKALEQAPDFARITAHSLEFFGLCNACLQRG